MALTGDASSPEAVAARAAAAVSAALAPGADAPRLQEAREAYEAARGHPAAHRVAFLLADARQAPEAQHLGLQTLLAALRARPPAAGLGQAERAEARAWMEAALPSDRWIGSPAYVQGKCAEVAAELARLDWPARWPGLLPAAFAAGGGPVPGAAALALAVLGHVADLLREDAKDLTAARRKELAWALAELADPPREAPSEAPRIVGCLQAALRQHGGDQRVVAESLRLCRAFAIAVPVQTLLKHNLDRIVQVGLDIPELRELAAEALAEWVDRMGAAGAGAGGGRGGGRPTLQVHDMCRFSGMLARLAGSCRFDGDQQSYGFHAQVAELLSDLCAGSAASLTTVLRSAELGVVWQALFHLLRYPSARVQLDALQGMWHLARAASQQNGGQSVANGAPPRPPLEHLLGVLFVHHIKAEQLPGETTPAQSAWLLRCLGPVAATQPVTSFAQWREMLACTSSFELQEAEKDSEERARVFGLFKTKARELLQEICPARAGGLAAPEGYGALCRTVGQLVAHVLAGAADGVGDSAARVAAVAFEAAVSLADRVGPALLKKAQKQKDQLPLVLEPSMILLQQVTLPVAGMSTASASGAMVETVRFEFLSHWALFYPHFGGDVAAQVVQRLIAVIENPPDVQPAATPGRKSSGSELQRRALDTLIGLGKHGSIRAEHLEAFYEQCQRLAPLVTPNARGKLCEALVAAVAAAPSAAMASSRKAQLIQGLLTPATQQWCSLALVAPNAGSAALATSLASVFAAAASGGEFPLEAQAHFDLLRDTKQLLGMFVGVVARVAATSAGGGAEDAGGSAATPAGTADDAAMQDCGGGTQAAEGDAGLEEGLVQAWHPGVFELALALAGLPAAVSSGAGGAAASLAALLSLPGQNEHLAMLGGGAAGQAAVAAAAEEGNESVGGAGAAKQLQIVRQLLWDLRVFSAKALRACVGSRGLWRSCPAANGTNDESAAASAGAARLKALAETLPAQRPHVAELSLREVFLPLFGSFKATAGMEMIPAAARLPFCQVVVPALMTGGLARVRACWGPASAQPPVPPSYEAAVAASCVSLSRTFATLLQALVGSTGVVFGEAREVTTLMNPERELFFVDRVAQASAQARGAQPQGAAARRRKKDRTRNRFSALADAGDDDEDDDAAGDGEDASAAPSGIAGAAASVMRDAAVRSAVLTTLSGLLELPERELVQRAFQGLHVWTAQLWNLACRGELSHSIGGARAEAGELIHAASDALRVVPASVVRPIARLVAKPPSPYGPFGEESAQRAAALVGVVQAPWSAYHAAKETRGKGGPSQLVEDADRPLTAALIVLTKLFRIQCRKVGVAVAAPQLYLSPALSESLAALRELPNTTEADVAALLDLLLAESSLDEIRGAVRALLYEASPAFAAAGASQDA
eukprot:TRINITY_DN14128_c0_g2_i1.p1 TRINITY_DN14128_c0_g2~~TRINITY_DN14128_c0_g2_i1.p1  ORF type:complete len:1397 (+),score=381.82 TRINITY_DN14128_c0_g2_i1:117-4307(+)